MEARPDMDETEKPEEGPEKATEEATEATHSPIDFDKDGKASTQETAIAITLLVVGGGLLAWLMWLASQGQITEETIQPLIVVLAFLSGKEGFKRLSGGG
jgi:ABC-type transport system involved in cytochrome bd biosynthesis fused ATPase/permease subunit